MNVTATTLHKLDFPRVQGALAARAASPLGVERALAVSPTLEPAAAERAWARVSEALSGPELSLGGVSDIRPLIARIKEGQVLEGLELLEIAYTMDAAGTIKRAVLASERPALAELAARLGSFSGALRLVREQLDPDGRVRDDATPKLREIRRRLNPLRGRIRERLQELLGRYADYVQEGLITLRRDRYVIPVRASAQSRVPGIVLDTSDSGATVFIEPQSVVPLNNELALLEFEERDEVRRILVALGQRLAFEPALEGTLEALAELDVVAASARLAKDWRLTKPSFDTSGAVRLTRARHPLVDGCVPNTLELDAERRLLIVTGPNAGGKTVLLKTLGLAAVMARSGLFVAAETATLPPFRALLTDIGDEQSIEASLSTYAGHLRNLRAIVEAAAPDVLVLVDELGSGTDPDEGAALSQAIVERLLESGARGLINTHLAPLKVFASQTPGVQNAAMSFDVGALSPRFELMVGQPGRSYALAIAERLGLPEALLARAHDILGPEGAALETLLQTLERQREALQAERDELAAAREVAAREAAVLREQIERLREREGEVLAAAAARADELLQETLQRAKELKRTATTDPEARPRALSELQRLRKEVQARTPHRTPKAKGPAPKPALAPGATVFVEAYGAKGQVLELRGDDVVVQLGLLKVTVPKSGVRLDRAPKPQRGAGGGYSAPARFESELNIRGERVEAALDKLRDFLLEAHALKAERVRILHGKGTGTLRDVVRSFLKDDKRVERFEDAPPTRGATG